MKSLTLGFFLVLLIFTNCNNETKVESITNNKNKIEEPTDEIVEKFYQSIFSNDLQLSLKMLDSEFPGDFEPKNKVTPLQAAIWQNNLVLVKKLVENKANINSKKNSSVEEASEYGTYEILKYLVERNGSINNEAFSKAKNYECAKFLLERGANQNLGDVRGKLNFYLEAVKRNDILSIRLLDLKKNELDYNNCDGETALIIAIKNENIDLVKYLVELGVDTNKPETFDCGDEIRLGKTPFDLAKETNNEEIIHTVSNNAYKL